MYVLNIFFESFWNIILFETYLIYLLYYSIYIYYISYVPYVYFQNVYKYNILNVKD